MGYPRRPPGELSCVSSRPGRGSPFFALRRPRPSSMLVLPRERPHGTRRSATLCACDPRDGVCVINFDAPSRLPPSLDGEWWELRDETRGGIPYYYHTKSGDTTWEKPDGFVIPLGVIQVRATRITFIESRHGIQTYHLVQNTSLGRKLSQSTRRHSQLFPAQSQPTTHTTSSHPHSHPSQSSLSRPSRRVTSQASPPSIITEHSEDASGSGRNKTTTRRDRADDPPHSSGSHSSHASQQGNRPSPTTPRTRSKSSHISPTNGSQSLTAAVEFIAGSGTPRGANGETVSAPEVAQRDGRSQSDHGHGNNHDEDNRHSSRHQGEKRNGSRSLERRRKSFTGGRGDGGSAPSTPITKLYQPNTPSRDYSSSNVAMSPQNNAAVSAKPYGSPNVLQKSPRRPIPAVPSSSEIAGFWRPRRNTAVGMQVNIGNPVLDIGKCCL